MWVYVYELDKAAERRIIAECLRVLHSRGCRTADRPDEADVAIAPYLTRKLSKEEIEAPLLGTLIFHPSLLPRHRGRDAIKWAFRMGEPYTGATWFWADEGLDTGPICEMEVLAMRNETPREFYERAVIPAAARMLGYIIDDLKRGYVRRRPQIEENATYEPPIPKTPAR